MHETKQLETGVYTAPSLDAVLLKPVVFTRPLRLASPPSWLPHAPFAFWLVEALRPGVLVELGTHSGNSYAALAQAVQVLGLDTACYSVDTWRGDHQAGFYDERVFEEWSAFHDTHFRAFSRLVRSTFDEARQTFPDRSIDLLHIDGLHTYEAIRHDFESWLPKLSNRAVILMHDINVRDQDFGAWRFWEEIERRYPSLAFLHAHGLGVVAVGADPPADVRWLLSKLPGRDSEASLVKRFCATLGGAVEQDYELACANRAQAALQARTERLEATLGAREAELDAATATGQKHVQTLTSQVAEREAQIERGQNERAQLVVQLSTAAAQIRRAEEVAQDRAVEIDQLQAIVAAGEVHIERQRVRVQSLQEEADGLRDALDQFEHDRAAVESDATSLRIQLADLHREHMAARLSLASVTQEFERMCATRAWRWTAPLRRASGLGLRPLFHVRAWRGAKLTLKALLSPRRVLEIRRVALSDLFDRQYYLARYPDVRASGASPIVHYVLAGAREGRSPHPLFDGAFYLARHQDVRDAGANPLVHYVLRGGAERRDPHPLFSTVHYLRQQSHVGTLGGNPLGHFLARGGMTGCSPHPLFDAQFYLAQNADVREAGTNPLVHFLDSGARERRAPHPLFDPASYLRRYPDVRASGLNPLQHYLEHVPGEDRDPHPLFDSSYYLERFPDLVRLGVNPLLHFVEHGWREGRRPNPVFDPRWYLEMNPDVAASGRNPLEHFVRFGCREGRDPSPEFDTSFYVSQHPDVAGSGESVLAHYLAHGKREGRAARPATSLPRLPTPRAVTMRVSGSVHGDASDISVPTIICLTHVVPFPPRAGNEYRVLRLLKWLRRRGCRVVLVMAPLPGHVVEVGQMQMLEETVGNVVLCSRDGHVSFNFGQCADVLSKLTGLRTRNFAALLGESRAPHGADRKLLEADRTYCHDTAMETTLRLQSTLKPAALIVDYVWMSRVLPLVDRDILRIIDSLDVFSTRRDKVVALGISDWDVPPDQEARRLSRADLVLAIQDGEGKALQQLVPQSPVITVGVDFEVVPPTRPPRQPHVLIVGSGNPMNRRGLGDFLRFAWPAVLADVPDARLIVAGPVSTFVPDDAPQVESIGPVEDLAPLYADARVVINPAAAGTGLKIKTVEALAHFRPIVTWPAGLEGVPDTIQLAMPPAGDWLEFADQVVRHLASDAPALEAAVQTAIRDFLSSDTAYSALDDRLSRFFADAARAGTGEDARG